jgi:hypothetical protein
MILSLKTGMKTNGVEWKYRYKPSTLQLTYVGECLKTASSTNDFVKTRYLHVKE